VQCLEQLRDRGVTLYLASGTDHQDVVKEAEALGVAHFFKGGIYGAMGDVAKYSRRGS
jgi:phosphoglycolate phosphatase-like HAD superfamily hydrolase